MTEIFYLTPKLQLFPNMRFCIITYGCQMNRYDSDALAEKLIRFGHQPADMTENADFVIVNTCSVRQHAEDRALGRISELVRLKKHNPNVKIGVVGCVAQRIGDKLMREIPGIDFVVGPDALESVIAIVNGDIPCGIYIDKNSSFCGLDVPAHTKSGDSHAFVTVMRGCDNYCSYCIVPYVRGRARSLPPEKIIAEIKSHISKGIIEITLLGQNVNEYKYGNIDFPALLEMVAQIDGFQRIRFVTNHPKDFSPDILDIVEKYRCKIPPAFHLPLQSGSNRILELMNRKYTVEKYLSLVENIYRRFPDSAISTDIIAGFPTETEKDFESTLDVMRYARFSGVFSFHYSPREGTKASSMPDDVPRDVKIERLKRVIALGQQLAGEFSKKMVGTIQKVVVTGKAEKKPQGFFEGTTESGRKIIFQLDDFQQRMVDVKVTSAGIWILYGEVI